MRGSNHPARPPSGGWLVPILGMVFLLGWALSFPAAGAAWGAVSFRVSASAPILRGDVAQAQGEAMKAALEKAVEAALRTLVQEKRFRALMPLFEARVYPQAEVFVATYIIEKQDAGPSSYMTTISASVDTSLLRSRLVRLGIIKEKGSPALAAIFVSVEANLGQERVQGLARLAAESLGPSLEEAGLTVLPGSEGETLFRLVRPPQTPSSLVAEGLGAMADVAVGAVFQKAGEASRTGEALTVPLKMTFQAVDVGKGSLAGVEYAETAVTLGTGEEVSGKGVRPLVDEAARRLARALGETYGGREAARSAVRITLEGDAPGSLLREAFALLLNGLEKEATLLPIRFSPGESLWDLVTAKGEKEVEALLSTHFQARGFQLRPLPGGFLLRPPPRGTARPTATLGSEIPFHRKLPFQGALDPENIRKTEVIPWQEEEPNDRPDSANNLPLGEKVLGWIKTPRDKDAFRILLPSEAARVAYSVEQTGPGEFRPRLRLLLPGGDILADRSAPARGKELRGGADLPPGTPELLAVVEDNLSRSPSAFPYVLMVGLPDLSEEPGEGAP